MNKPLNAKIDADIYNDFYSACKLKDSKMTIELSKLMQSFSAKVMKADPVGFAARKENDLKRKTQKK